MQLITEDRGGNLFARMLSRIEELAVESSRQRARAESYKGQRNAESARKHTALKEVERLKGVVEQQAATIEHMRAGRTAAQDRLREMEDQAEGHFNAWRYRPERDGEEGGP